MRAVLLRCVIVHTVKEKEDCYQTDLSFDFTRPATNSLCFVKRGSHSMDFVTHQVSTSCFEIPGVQSWIPDVGSRHA